MAGRIEDYALIGDCQTAALVGRDGSIDWLCWPRFDADACFAALLGNSGNGRWRIAPAGTEARSSRRYLPDTLVLETRFETEGGSARLIDFMSTRAETSDVIRLVVGEAGQVDFEMELVLRFGYGATVPWVSRLDHSLRAIAGPDMAVLRTPVSTHGVGLTTVGKFTVAAGDRVPFVLSYGPSHEPPPPPLDPEEALQAACRFWRDWSRRSDVEGPYEIAIKRSLITLKAMTHAPTGGLVAAPTTSLPEAFGGPRNWDYRYCWLRDATLTLLALINVGHHDEAKAWIGWLRRAVAGSPQDLQIMYGVGGERRLLEWQADWLDGYEGSRPVRIGNAAHQQVQLDVYGELMDAFHQARRAGLASDDDWPLERVIVDHVAKIWSEPDEGIWEVRSGPHQFTYSKIMSWVAMDRAIAAIEEHGLDGPLEDWRRTREAIRADVLRNGVNLETGAFQRAYDDPGPDASLLLAADLGFVQHDDPIFLATVAEVERKLMTAEGLLLRYDTRAVDDGLPPGEGAFLPCSFWLANAYAMTGRKEEAKALFERLLALCNDVGLLGEEYDADQRRLAGNFPQAFSHVGLITTACNLAHGQRPSQQRASQGPSSYGADGRRASGDG